MQPKERLEAALRKAKIEWRRVIDSPESTSSQRRRALADWKKALARREFALIELQRARAERRKTIIDRRKATIDRRISGAEGDGARAQPDRRKNARRP
jgi:hypothetical protein